MNDATAWLAQIGALCDTAEREAREWLAAHPEDEGVLRPSVDVAEVRAILDASTVDVTQVRRVLNGENG